MSESNTANRLRIVLERAIVLALIDHLKAEGWKPTVCNYGDGNTRFSYKILWDVDKIAVAFTKANERTITHDVVLVFGNGEDIISDWRYSADDGDGFNASMERFSRDWTDDNWTIRIILSHGARAARSIKS